MSALRLINETELSSATIFDITDVFTTDFDIYQVTLNNMNTSADAGVYLQFLNTSMLEAVDNTIAMYNRAGFKIKVVLIDLECVPLKDAFFTRGVILNATSKRAYVPEIETTN